jgi:hypothetical protein
MPVIAPILIGSLFAIVQGTATAGPMPSFSPVPKPTLRVMLTRQNCQMVQQYVQECSRSCQQPASGFSRRSLYLGHRVPTAALLSLAEGLQLTQR